MNESPPPEAEHTKSFQKRLTYPLIGLLILIIIGICLFFYINKKIEEPIVIKDVKVDTSAVLKLNALNQISKKNGITEWELTAATATLLKDENKAILENVSVVFYTQEKTKVHLKSQHGVLNTKSHDMVFSDNVVVTYNSFVLKTDKLQYTKKKHIIFSDVHVRLEKANSSIDADSMVTQLNKNQTILKGHIKGYFSEKFSLK